MGHPAGQSWVWVVMGRRTDRDRVTATPFPSRCHLILSACPEDVERSRSVAVEICAARVALSQLPPVLWRAKRVAYRYLDDAHRHRVAGLPADALGVSA